jgi:LPXTG-site transpeptidase (sortase) family protein
LLADPESHGKPVERLTIPRIDIDADVVTLGIDQNWTMQAPKDPEEIGWYWFSAQPGDLGNAVFAGHLDFEGHGPAVFWRLNEVRKGDEIAVTLRSGTVVNYRVTNVTSYDADSMPMEKVVGPTNEKTITLITCSGTFSRATRDYDKRLVVRGERL